MRKIKLNIKAKLNKKDTFILDCPIKSDVDFENLKNIFGEEEAKHQLKRFLYNYISDITKQEIFDDNLEKIVKRILKIK